MATRSSTELGYKATQTLYYAIGEQAERIGLPLNVRVTINFSETGIDPRDAVAIFARLRTNHFNKWASRPRNGQAPAYEPTYAYVFENARDGTAFEECHPAQPHNVHVHWKVHVPDTRRHEFECEVYAWLDYITGAINPSNAVMIQTIDNIKGARRYSLKGTSEKFARRFGTDHKPQGLVVGGRRSGTSRNLGPTARISLDKALRIRRRIAA